MSRHSSPSRSRPRRALPRWLKVSLVAVLVGANLAALGMLWTIRTAEDAFRDNAIRLDDVVPELSAHPAESSEPLYFLVIGSDSRQGVDRGVFGDFGGARGDVVMVVRLDRAGSQARLLSIPRDTWVEIDGRSEDKINAAYAYGGASLMVNTVRNAFDLPVHHYVEVDFAGFQALVDELGGVEMTFSHPARDRKARLDVPAGTITLDGFQALAYARSRNYHELHDEGWRSVDASDLGRARRQQALVVAILQAIVRPSSLPETGSLVASLAQHMTVDGSLADSSLAELAFSMRDISPSNIETATLPTVSATRNRASVQLVDQPAASVLLEAFRSGRPMDEPDSGDILSLHVLNGNGITGSAADWAARLGEAGYEVVRVGDASEQLEQTTVLVGPGRLGLAHGLVETLGFGEVRVGAVPEEADAVVILGTDASTPGT